MSTDTLATKAVHAGEPVPRIRGASTVPIFQSTVFESVFGTEYGDIKYPRHSNLPNHELAAKKIAALEGAEAGLVAASGMAAISTTLFSVVGHGGHVLAQRDIYGGTAAFLGQDAQRFGFSCDFINAENSETWEKALRSETRAIYVEAMSNPLLAVPDHQAVVAFARKHGLKAIIDNTFATPINFQPIALGYDIVLHSCTKYLNGHSDVAAGAVVGTEQQLRDIKHLLDHLGGSLDAHSCWLLTRGMKTLALRIAQHNKNALALARFLQEHPTVERVNYPGLHDHPQHTRANALFSGFGGMLSFEMTGAQQSVDRLVERLKLPMHAPSLGGVESLVTQPARTSHLLISAEQRQAIGIRDNLVRISAGIEGIDDLIADFRQALS